MFNQYPYLNLNDLNLDYILKAIKEMRYEVTNFVSINAIKYADPIQWNITSQYEKNTIVIDPVTGTAYISVAPVPVGVALTRPEYWTVVFDLGSFVTRAAQNFTSHWESDTTLTATFPTPAGGWLVWGDVLYKALVNITAGDSYVVDGNIEHFTIEELYNEYLNTIAQILVLVGDLADLTTSDATSIVNAINSVVHDYKDADDAINATIGDLDDLATTDKSSIVKAINSEVQARQDADTDLYNDIVNVINALHVNVVADIANGTYNDGDYVQTSGYYAINDGGGALYKIYDDTNVTPSNATDSNGVIHFSLTQSAELILNEVNARQFGAHGDGLVNDTAALQAAIDYAAPKRKTVHIPSGRYHTTSPITITTNVTIRGDSMGNTTFIDQFDTGVFNITSTSGAWFYDLFFTFSPSTTVNNCAFYMNNAFGLNLNNIEQVGQSYAGATEGMLLHAVGTSRNIIMENVFCDCGGSTFALNFDLTYNNAASDIVMRNCFIDNYLGKLINLVNVSDILVRGSILRCKNTIFTARNTQAPWCFITNSCNTLDSVVDSSNIYDIGDKVSILDDSTFADRNNKMAMTGASFYYRQHDTGYVITESLDLFDPLNAAGYGLRSRTFNPFWAFNTAADDTIKGAFYKGESTYNEITLDVMGASTGLRYGIALKDSTTPDHYMCVLYAPRTGMCAMIEYTNGVENIVRQWFYWDVPAHQFSAVRNLNTGIWTLLIGNGRGVYQPIGTPTFDGHAKVGIVEITNNTQGLQTIVDLINGRFLN